MGSWRRLAMEAQDVTLFRKRVVALCIKFVSALKLDDASPMTHHRWLHNRPVGHVARKT
jgi:hypothetical protein